MTRVWRLAKAKHAAFNGAGARLHGGRWNHPGVPVVYTSATLSLATLEFLVHLDQDEMPGSLVAVSADIPAGVPITRIDARPLPADWRTFPAPADVVELGTAWVRSGATAMLAAPSVVIPHEWNYILNPRHRAFSRIRIGQPQPFVLDTRLH